MKPAVEVFGEWALKGKDEGMERGHASSVAEMLAYAMAKTIPSKEEFTAIDIGCGNGWVVREISQIQSCSKAAGVDGAIEMIDKANQIDKEGLGEYYHGMLPDWEPEEKYDLVHSMECFYYLENPVDFVKIVHDTWMNNGGYIVMGVDHYAENEDSLDWPEHVGVHMTTLSEKEWLKAFTDAGFEDLTAWRAGTNEGFVGTLVIGGKKAD